MSGGIDPFSFPDIWDTVLVSGVKSPGLCKLSNWKRAHEWDVKKGKGTLGAIVTFVGRPPAKGSIEFRLWTAQHFVDWDVFRALLKFDPSKKTIQAIPLYHPALADLEISQVVTENIGAIEHQGQGLYTISVDLIEYFPPPKRSAVGTPTGSKKRQDPNAPGTQTDPVSDALQKQIATLMQQAQTPP